MTEQHRAYHNQWTYVRRQAELGHSDPSCILELLSRVEALEASLTAVSLELRDRVEALEAAEPAESNDPAGPNSSLVTLVGAALISNSPFPFREQARAAIHAIAHWLDQQKLHIAATELRQEVG